MRRLTKTEREILREASIIRKRLEESRAVLPFSGEGEWEIMDGSPDNPRSFRGRASYMTVVISRDRGAWSGRIIDEHSPFKRKGTKVFGSTPDEVRSKLISFGSSKASITGDWELFNLLNTTIEAN